MSLSREQQLQGTLDKLQGDIDALKQKIAEYEADVKIRGERISDLVHANYLTALNNNLTALNNRLDRYEAKRDRLEAAPPAPPQQVPVSPRLKGCVFVLAAILPNAFPISLGTAWVVNSSSMTLLITACHCLIPQHMGFEAIQDHLFVAKSITMNDDGTIIYDSLISVQAIAKDPVCDVAVLQAQTLFSECIPICPLDQFPTADNEDVVKTYHVPCQSFPQDVPMLSSSPTEYRKVVMESKHHYFLPGQHMHGSSGGVVVDVQGRAVALICSGYIPGIEQLPIPDSFQTLWETVSALSEGRGNYTRCVKFNVIPLLYTFLMQN